MTYLVFDWSVDDNDEQGSPYDLPLADAMAIARAYQLRGKYDGIKFNIIPDTASVATRQ